MIIVKKILIHGTAKAVIKINQVVKINTTLLKTICKGYIKCIYKIHVDNLADTQYNTQYNRTVYTRYFLPTLGQICGVWLLWL